MGKGTHRGSDTQGTNKKKKREIDNDKKRRRRKRATENSNERGKKAFQRRKSQMEVFSKSIAVCLAKLRKYVQFDIRAHKKQNNTRQFGKEKVGLLKVM